MWRARREVGHASILRGAAGFASAPSNRCRGLRASPPKPRRAGPSCRADGLAGERGSELPADPGRDARREAFVVERNLVLVLAHVAVEQPGRPLRVERIPGAPAVEALAAEDVSARLPERVAEDGAAPDDAVGPLALEPEQDDRLVVGVAREVQRVRREHHAPAGDLGQSCGDSRNDRRSRPVPPPSAQPQARHTRSTLRPRQGREIS